ncbi:LamG-like jellyroll fold domain-containing protein [Microbulbifer halophilus]|uniref:LamG-like jellyroll fold domain-containing protein n=1 Tax=Microbulbifer halophilus TaxID=453963 RepID=A0ABW5EEV9_9GAMM|nr:LamG-like jellyroll fold domain-containing protein [Microbulbifer halophilus]MCW8126295.1 family 43 glycosylhydrolase [Microbulbifer halophilus]
MKVAAIIGRLTLALSFVLPLYGCGGDSGSSPAPEEPPSTSEPDPADPTADTVNYNDMAVHDPSVIRDEDGTYYVFGSHLAAAKTGDLMHWERVANEVNDANPLFNTYASEISEGIEWVGGHQGSWAADVIRLGDGRYYFYYNHCANPASEAGDCDTPRSYLGVAVSDSIEGPYTDLGIFLRSGMTDEEIAAGYGPEGLESYDPTIHPNAIDPDAFYDKDGRLWMTYGSYSGGIFILEMDESTGKPLPGQGYGKHLTGGDHSAIEGTYMLYSPESDYYYLFMSFGGYVSTDGYNIRVARSRNPDGPFVDAGGNAMTAARGNWNSIEPYGVKLMGGFTFASDPGDPVPERGYLAPGHNSAYYDGDAGRHLLFTHTRFPGRGEEHAIRVHEMYVNADGWLVASPHRYAPIEGDNIVDSGDLVGDYKFIDHGRDINRDAKQTRYIHLNEDGSIGGEISGEYQLFEEEPRRIDLTLEIDGNSKSYRGVMQWQWNSAAGELVPIFTALNGEGESVWGSRMDRRTEQAVLQSIADDLQQPDVARGGSLELPQRGTRAAAITWDSDNTLAIDNNGRVTRPNVGNGDTSATLTADITLNGQQLSRSYTVQVPQRLPYNRAAHFAFEDDLSESLGRFDAGTATADRISNNGSVAYTAGHNNRALQLNGSNGVLLPEGLIDNDVYTVSLWANPTAIAANSPAFFGADEQLDDSGLPDSNRWISFLPEGWDGNTMLWSGSEQWLDGTTGERIAEGAWTHLAFAVDEGHVRVYLDGEEKFSGGTLGDLFTGGAGRFALGVNYWDAPYHGLIDELKIYDSALSAEEIRLLDIDPASSAELLASAVQQLDLGDTSAVRDHLYLPTSGAYASAIDWISSDPDVIAINGETGVVTRPQNVDAQVTLTADIALDGEQQTKNFDVTVKKEGPPNAVATFAFEQNLHESSGNFGPGTVVGATIDASGGTVSYTEGVEGRALVLDGNSGVRLPDNLITDNSYSFTLWLSPSALTDFTPALFGWDTTERWISLLPRGGEGDTKLWSGTDWYDANTGSLISTDAWTHMAVTVDGGETRVFINGEQQFSGNGFPDIFGTAETSHFALGVNYWDTPYAGMMDELKIYENAVPAADIRKLYEAELLAED